MALFLLHYDFVRRCDENCFVLMDGKKKRSVEEITTRLGRIHVCDKCGVTNSKWTRRNTRTYRILHSEMRFRTPFASEWLLKIVSPH